MSGKFHHTNRAVSVSQYCKKCERVTPHRVNRTVGDCLHCLYKLDPKILSKDELSVLGISEPQLNLDVWKWTQARNKRNNSAVQEALFV
jgi:hypothetical protein